MDTVQMFEALIKKMESYHPAKSFTMVEKAYKLADEAHGNQLRKSGEPYIVHPLAVALLLADFELDIESITAGILHDVIEDTPYTYDDISRMFSDEIALLVDGVTKLDKLSYSSKEEVQAANYRKMFLAMAKDIRVILIKLVDRLHNMRTLDAHIPRKQVEIAQETLDIYAPLAMRLGINKIQSELEDLSLKYLKPEAYTELYKQIQKRQTDGVGIIKQIVETIENELAKYDVKANVEGRAKHLFSIYKKMTSQNKPLDQIYDLFAVRIVVDSIPDCYSALGYVHGLYKPIPGRFKNYIATPKQNNYQSLHDTLLGPSFEPFEVQIRTFLMHRTNEYGIAAHWKYKSAGSGDKGERLVDNEEAKLAWLREILEWQKELDNKEYMEALKTDLDVYKDQVYAFTPKGHVITIPKGSTPIDFAYMIHSAVGNKMVGAKVNNRIEPFDYEIINGDRIEIITSQNSQGPSRDWLKIVKSQQAKTKISQWFKSEYKEENIIRGKDTLEKEAKKKGYSLTELMRQEWIEMVLEKFGFQNWDAACAAVGHGGLKEGQVLNRLIEELEKEKAKNITAEDILKQYDDTPPVNDKYDHSSSGVTISGVGEVSVRFSKCCNPVPGDEIVGYVTKGRGLSIHRTDCTNMINLPNDEKKRIIEAEWHVKGKEVSFQAEIRLICEDRKGMLVDISKVLTDANISVKTLNGKTTKNNEAIFDILIEVSSKVQLEKIRKKLLTIRGVHEAVRVST